MNGLTSTQNKTIIFDVMDEKLNIKDALRSKCFISFIFLKHFFKSTTWVYLEMMVFF